MPTLMTLHTKKLKPSPFNTQRAKHYDKDALAELAASIKESGLIQPIVVRRERPTMDAGFEIIAGERRWRACKLANVNEIPCVVREMTDGEVIEAQLIENLQREDVQPLDEAEGYEALLKLDGYDADKVAESIGKSRSYVYQRIKLLALTSAAKKALRKGEIEAGHAILIARLTEADQTEALGYTMRKGYYDSGTLSVRQLQEYIGREINLRLKYVPFSPTDAELVPEAGPCTTCPKRAGSNPVLFAGMSKDTCTDRTCLMNKVKVYVGRAVAEMEEKDPSTVRLSKEYTVDGKGKKPRVYGRNEWEDARPKAQGGKGKCEHRAPGIIVTVPTYTIGEVHQTIGELGHRLPVCITPKCKTHFAYGSPSSSSSSSYQQAEKRERQKRHQEAAFYRRVLVELRPKLPRRLDRTDIEWVLLSFWEELWLETRKALFEMMGWEPDKTKSKYGPNSDYMSAFRHKVEEELTDPALQALLLSLVLVSEQEHARMSSKPERKALIDISSRYGVSLKRLRTKVDKELKAKKKGGKK